MVVDPHRRCHASEETVVASVDSGRTNDEYVIADI